MARRTSLDEATMLPPARGSLAAEPRLDAGPGGGDGDGPERGPEPAVQPRGIPADVSAAWELELLIAGAVTFALFQLPGSLAAGLAWAEPRLTGAAQVLVFCGYVYAKAIVYVLIVAFLLNLIARAYWVGLVGLHSVFPGGVRWDRLGRSAGPFMSAAYRERLSSLPAIIGRVDNFASVIFSFAFLIVLTFVVSVAAVAVLSAIAYGVAAALYAGQPPVRAIPRALMVVSAVALLPMMAAGLIDKFVGPRLAPGSPAARRMRTAARYLMVLNGSALFGPIFLTLLTNVRRRVLLPLFYGALTVALLLGLGDFFARTVGLSAGGSAYLPDDLDVRGIDRVYYESMRERGDPSTVPVIQSDVIDGPYVRLFIPYRPDRHDRWLAANCPGAAPLRASGPHIPRPPADMRGAGASAERTLACLARLHAVTVDGAAPPALAFRFFRHPDTGREGIVTYIATAALGAGMHTLTVQPPPRPPGARARAPLRPYEIVFWR